MESVKDLEEKVNSQVEEPIIEENTFVCLIIKDMSDTFIRYDVFN